MITILILLAQLSAAPNPLAGMYPGARTFDRLHFDVEILQGTERIDSSKKVIVVMPHDPARGLAMKVYLWPKCSASQLNEPQGPFTLENVSIDGFMIHGKRGQEIRWTCSLLVRKNPPAPYFEHGAWRCAAGFDLYQDDKKTICIDNGQPLKKPEPH